MQLGEEFVCAHIDKSGSELTLYQYNRLTKVLTKAKHTVIEDNSNFNDVMLRLSTSVEIVYKFSAKKGRHMCGRMVLLLAGDINLLFAKCKVCA